VEKQYVLHIMSVCSLSYPACKAHAPYYIVICGLSGCYHIFPHYVINGTIFAKKILAPLGAPLDADKNFNRPTAGVEFQNEI
jgi:hypothetical protein